MSWTGYYIQCGQKHQMNLGNINFQPGPGAIIKGRGTDEVGSFSLDGSFSPNEPLCRFTKHYDGQHSVYYEGRYDQSTNSISGHYGLIPGANDGEFKMQH